MDYSGVRNDQLQYILNTHSHYDHIGGNAQLVKSPACEVVPKTHAHWHHDWEAHYSEFARPFPEIFPDTEELRKEVFEIMDEPH